MALSCFVMLCLCREAGPFWLCTLTLGYAFSGQIFLHRAYIQRILMDIAIRYISMQFREFDLYHSHNLLGSCGFWETNSFGHLPCTFAKILSRNDCDVTVIMQKVAKCGTDRLQFTFANRRLVLAHLFCIRDLDSAKVLVRIHAK